MTSVAYPPDPDEREQVLIITAVIGEWLTTMMQSAFDSDAEALRQDIIDCAGNAAEALNNRRHALLEDAEEAAIESGALRFSAGADSPPAS